MADKELTEKSLLSPYNFHSNIFSSFFHHIQMNIPFDVYVYHRNITSFFFLVYNVQVHKLFGRLPVHSTRFAHECSFFLFSYMFIYHTSFGPRSFLFRYGWSSTSNEHSSTILPIFICLCHSIQQDRMHNIDKTFNCGNSPFWQTRQTNILPIILLRTMHLNVHYSQAMCLLCDTCIHS